MWEFLKDLPFSIEVWKTTSILFGVAIAFLGGVYNKYWKLRDETDSEIKETKKMVDEMLVIIVEIKKQYSELSETIDKFIKVITTTDEIGVKQKEQLELLRKIIQKFETKNVCEIKEEINVEGKEESINLKKLLDMICDEYELHKKE